MDKPIVHYEPEGFFIQVGFAAFVKTIDHPNTSNKSVVKTSKVISFDEESGQFETNNTIYEKGK